MLQIRSDYAALSSEIAARIAQIVRAKPDAVLGLATGSTPLGVYEALIRLHREENLCFAQTRFFNLDEYFPLEPSAPQSYHRFMREHLFDHLDVSDQNWRVPNGKARSMQAVENDCATYEAQIRALGGLDFQLLGIGRNGHIGFNEPGSARESRTRLVVLDSQTRADAAGDFFGLENVPIRAISLGVATILEAREIVLMASGAPKAAIVAAALEGKITSKVPASFLREHPNATFWLDEGAASALLERQNRPTDARKNGIRAALEQKCAIWELELSQTQKSALETDLRAKTDDEAILPRQKTVFCLSPHPDDDAIGCGATLQKLVARGNRVVIAYGVSGANAVRDKDVLALLRTPDARFAALLGSWETQKSASQIVDEARLAVWERAPGAPDAPLLRELKRLVREAEAQSACDALGATAIFLNLPFYGDGARRHAIGEADTEIMRAELEKVRPDLVMLTGELSDPHGTHEQCAQVFERAAACLQLECARWLYRGAYEEWPTETAHYFSVFPKSAMDAKIALILHHVSQLDPLFPGGDAREFWERARDRNRQAARELQTLGILPPSRSFDPLYVESFVICPR